MDAILWPDGDENRVGLLPKLVEEDRLSRKNVFDEVIDKSIHAGEGAFLTPSIVPMLSADGTEADMTVFGPTSEDDPNETSALDRRRPDSESPPPTSSASQTHPNQAQPTKELT